MKTKNPLLLPRTRKSLLRSFTVSVLWIHLAVLMIALLSGFFILLAISRRQTIREAEDRLAYMTYQMDNLIGSLSDMRSQLLQDKDMRSYLTTSRSYDVDDILLQRSVMNQLSIIISSCNYINSITVFHGDGPVLCVSKNMQIQGRTEDAPLPVQQSENWESITSTSGVTWGGQYQEMELFLTRYRQKEAGSTVVSILQPIADYKSSHRFSVFSVNIPTEYFNFLSSQHADEGAYVTLCDAKGDPLLSVPETAGTSEDSWLFQDVVITGRLSGTDWYLTERIPFSVFLRDSLPLLLTVSAIFLVAIFLAVLLSSLTGRRLLNPFQEITAQMKPINEGNLSQRLSPQKYDELNILVGQFNHMMEHIQSLVTANKNYAEEKRLLEMETLHTLEYSPRSTPISCTTASPPSAGWQPWPGRKMSARPCSPWAISSVPCSPSRASSGAWTRNRPLSGTSLISWITALASRPSAPLISPIRSCPGPSSDSSSSLWWRIPSSMACSPRSMRRNPAPSASGPARMNPGWISMWRTMGRA